MKFHKFERVDYIEKSFAEDGGGRAHGRDAPGTGCGSECGG